ncbi:hypothetical protein N3553_04750 [Pantoea dispersa]|uniref:hypothetical protein n=1 Tax=Pantoea TaxID=53335 RepID=UPI001CCDF32E|nr:MULTISPECIES: hypothetical protein [Pantoea]MCT6589183.1 hypothetical protein [Pantoea dispersa]UBN55306.1 hypothetical protein LB453_07030 [Pantoea agglomerans]
MKSGLTIRSNNAAAVLASLKAIAAKDVLVGIPEDRSERDDVPFGNAGIGYINENGSPAQNIPARPHLVPGVRSVQDQTVPHLRAAAQAAMSGNAAAADLELNRAGALAANGVKRYMTITAFTPLAERTIDARIARGRTGDKPLIDTGQYRRAITYVVRKKNANS